MKPLELTTSQQKRLDKYRKDGTLITHAITKGGLLYVKYHRKYSATYPIGISYLGRRGGVVEEYLVDPDGKKTLSYSRD